MIDLLSLCNYLCRNPQLNDFAQFIALRTLTGLKVSSLRISILNEGTHFLPVSIWGSPSDSYSVHLTDQSPIVDALLNFEVVKIKSSIEGKTDCYFPVDTIGTIDFKCDTNRLIKVDDETLKMIGGVVAIKISTLISSISVKEKKANSYSLLSSRQNEILSLIAMGKKNREIAEIIGFSESLVKQETVKIFKLLNIKKRNQISSKFDPS